MVKAKVVFLKALRFTHIEIDNKVEIIRYITLIPQERLNDKKINISADETWSSRISNILSEKEIKLFLVR
jgi:hypothetical protein